MSEEISEDLKKIIEKWQPTLDEINIKAWPYKLNTTPVLL